MRQGTGGTVVGVGRTEVECTAVTPIDGATYVVQVRRSKHRITCQL